MKPWSNVTREAWESLHPAIRTLADVYQQLIDAMPRRARLVFWTTRQVRKLCARVDKWAYNRWMGKWLDGDR